jgi:DNA-binding SARP family transcriptional activator
MPARSADDKVLVSRLIRLLGTNGYRLGALRTYENLRRRLTEEFGAKPSAVTEAIIASIRAR